MNTLTRWLTNSGFVAQALSSLKHSSTVRKTVMSAMQWRSDLGVAGTSDPLQHRPPLPKLDIQAVDADEEPPEEWEADDDVKGRTLGSPMKSKLPVRRKQSICRDTEVYEYSTEAEARAQTGRNKVGLKWIDTNKGSAEAPRYRSRLVCTEVRHKGVDPIFSATPPLETLRILLCVACQEDVLLVEDPLLISIADVGRAHFYADAVRDVCVRLPDEDSSQGCVGNCERQRTDLWTQPNDGESITLKFWRLEDFPEAWHLRATSSTRTWRRTFWCTVMIFSLWADRRGESMH